MKRQWLRWISVAAVVAVLTMTGACSDESDDVVTPVRVMELATVTKTEPETHLEVWRRQGDEVTLVAPQMLNGAKIGQRILVYYEAAVTDTVKRPVPVNITGASAIHYGKVKALQPDKITDYARLHYGILSQWQTGPWLNFQMLARMGEETGFTLVADEETLDSDEVECYFVAVNPPEGNAYTDRRTYASYDISGLIRHEGQRVKIMPPALNK